MSLVDLHRSLFLFYFRYSLTDQGLALAERLNLEETGMTKEHVEQKSEEENSQDGLDVVDLTLEEEEKEEEEEREEKESWWVQAGWLLCKCKDVLVSLFVTF